jgi:hypothetical protein
VPRHVVAVRDPLQVVVLDAGRLTGEPVAALPRSYGLPRAVATGHDDRTFYAALDSGDSRQCAGAVYRLTTGGDVTRVFGVAGFLSGLAVSPDGRRIAYAAELHKADVPPPSSCGGEQVVRVRDLGSGAERTLATTRGNVRGAILEHLTWSPDGRYVAYAVGDQAVHRVEVDAAPVVVPALPTPAAVDRSRLDESGLPPAGTTCVASAPAYLPTGELAVAYRCTDDRSLAVQSMRLVVFDPVTQAPGRVLLTLDTSVVVRWVAFDPTGRHAYLGLLERRAESAEGVSTVRRWDGGALTPPLLEGRPAGPLSW